MYEFLTTATDRAGKTSTRVVRGENSQEVVAQLEAEGCTAIVLHTDDAAAVSSMVNYEDLDGVSPDDLLEFRAMSTGGLFLFLLKKTYYSLRGIMLIAGAYIAFSIYQGHMSGVLFYTAVGLLVLPVVLAFYFSYLGLSRKYEQFLEHWAWGRWEDVLRFAPRLEGKIPGLDLDARVAVALAKTGEYAQGLAKITRHESDPDSPHWMYLSRLAEFYEIAGKNELALEAIQQAYENDPDNPTTELDYALMLLRLETRLDEADRLLESVQEKSLSDLLEMVLLLGQGLRELNRRQYQTARDLLLEARRQLLPVAAQPLVHMILDINSAYLAMACAHAGEAETALKFYRPAKKRLEALGSERLLNRLNDAMQKYG